MMAQYQAIRRSLPEDILLLYRLGDFYEMFFEDAKIAAPILNVALTKRHDVPMAGVPHHAATAYIAKLVKAGKRVALAEQTSEPKPGQLVEREISQIISASTIDDLTVVDDTRHNYLAAACQLGSGKKLRYGLACADHSTGEFALAEFSDLDLLRDEIHRLAPSELLIPDDQLQQLGRLPGAFPYDAYAFLAETAEHTLKDHFKVQSLRGFGCAEMTPAICAGGATLHYLAHQLRRNCDHLATLTVRDHAAHVLIDTASQLNLDLVQSRSGTQHTLLATLDRTATPMGARKLRDWVLHPLRDREALDARLDTVEQLLAEPYLLSKLRETLKDVRDIERTTGRLSQGSGNPRDLKTLQNSLERIPVLREDLASLPKKGALSAGLLEEIREFPELTSLFSEALHDEPPASPKDGNLIRDGYSPELDELRAASREGKNWLAELQESERKRTGIETLKVKFNNVFGYFLEVSKAKVSLVPDDYQRKQTMANAERYITPALKEMEQKILGSDERAKALEYDLFVHLRQQVCEHLAPLQATAEALATLDVLLSFAETAQLYQHTRPQLTSDRTLHLSNARHPVLEQTLVEEKFVPNDTSLDPESGRLHILTGPNMAGKSTYIRQVALITLMAQIGAYVPAEKATIGLVDKIFCRVGASDDLAQGQSTFMVEMNETALIVNNATADSLVILDEIGRGTATFDGLSIAWAVAEHLHDLTQSRTLFATHYHELCDLASTRESVENYNVAVREWNEDIIFLRKIQPGPADKSYGIQVARLAGLPPAIIKRATEILSHLEMSAQRPDSAKKSPNPKAKSTRETLPQANSPQLDLFALEE
ncbi:DNA mismatch repair protein MutS [Roseibacillus ishigakijimensis]|uniref:DNA mismatch repair protein MutS n=2 Tax=Roseibacillus ishigakijimensis TaxID=454146 RepID=A0A934RJC4_9BACT|nr:DNA mismatch repair protein MutS [Roseibacillus ishigakijimensis]